MNLSTIENFTYLFLKSFYNQEFPFLKDSPIVKVINHTLINLKFKPIIFHHDFRLLYKLQLKYKKIIDNKETSWKDLVYIKEYKTPERKLSVFKAFMNISVSFIIHLN